MAIAVGLGLLVGLILALTGSGGSIIAVPLLIFGLGWDVARAGPVALFAVGLAAALGAAIGLRAGIVRYRAAALMALSGSLLTPLGMLAAHHVPARPLTLVFAGVLGYVALRIQRQAEAAAKGEARAPSATLAPCLTDSLSGRFAWTPRCFWALSRAGAATGFLSGMLGVGGGFVIVPALNRTTDLSPNSVVATSLAVIALVSVSAVTSAAIAGKLDVGTALPFAAGSFAGMIGGRLIAKRLAGPRLQQVFGLIAALAAIALAVRALVGL